MTAQMKTQPPADDFSITSLEQFDEAFAVLAKLSDDLNKVLARRNRSRRRLEQRYALIILPILQMIQKLIEAMKAYAQAHRRELVRKDTKGRILRPLGEMQFRSSPQVVTEVPDDVLVERFFRTGGKVRELFVREKPVQYEVARSVMLRPENRQMVDDIEGVSIDTSEVCLIKPAGVSKALSSGQPLWPFPLEVEAQELEDSDLRGLADFLQEIGQLWKDSLSRSQPAEAAAE